MKKFSIKHQNDLILGIIGALKTSLLGKGIRELHDIKIDRGHYDSRIQFTRKDGKDINFKEFFLLAHMIGRDYQS